MTSEHTATRAPAGMTPERVGFFTDAVFAIAMTLLVIEIPRPEDDAEFKIGDELGRSEAARNLLHFLADQFGSLLAYVLAFYVLWNAWRAHHRLFDDLARLSPGMLRWHFPFLLLIGFLPYPTTIVGHYSENPVAAALYTLGVGGVMICRSGVQTQALRDGLLKPDADAETLRGQARVSWAVAIYWTATVVLVWWTPWTIVAWLGTPIVASVLNRRRLAAAKG